MCLPFGYAADPRKRPPGRSLPTLHAGRVKRAPIGDAGGASGLSTARMEIAIAPDPPAHVRATTQKGATPTSAGRSGRRLNNRSPGLKGDDMAQIWSALLRC